jgi:hypothetical protein
MQEAERNASVAKKGAEMTVVQEGNCRKKYELAGSQKNETKICDLGSPGSRDFSNIVITESAQFLLWSSLK